jgi:hypothetical protein
MKNKLSFIAALLCFAVGIAALWLGRLELAKSPMLMVFISFWLLMGFLFALHADTAGNLQVIVQNVPVLRGIANVQRTPADVQVVVPPPDEAHHDA